MLAWPLSQPAGRNSGLGIATPSAHLVGWTGTGDAEYMNWGTLLILGLIVGSYVAATASAEFRAREWIQPEIVHISLPTPPCGADQLADAALRRRSACRHRPAAHISLPALPPAQIAKRSVGGGIAMGVGAVLAGGCTVGNGMVATGLFSWQGWVAIVAMALGAGVAARIYLLRKPLLPESVRKLAVRGDSADAGSAETADAKATAKVNA